jgi:AcrR family transcriptional regulator
MAEDKADRRSQRTRRLLTAALVELMFEKRFEDISVQDILDRADIGRSTFYGHFSSKEALLYSSLGDMLHGLEVHMAEEGNMQRGDDSPGGGIVLLPSLGLFRHIKQHQRLYRALFSSSSLEPVTQNLHRQLAQVVERNLRACADTPAGRPPAVPLPILAGFAAGAFLTLLRCWLEGNDSYTPEQVDAMFQQMVLPGVKAALEGRG